MPEGPEVKIIVDHLNSVLAGRTLIDIKCDNFDKFFGKTVSIGGKIMEEYNWLKACLPCKLLTVFCKGKFIFFHLRSLNEGCADIYLNSHLRMTGRWAYEDSGKTKLKLIFGKVMINPSCRFLWAEKIAHYEDPRGLGKFRVYDKAGLDAKLMQLGPDILSDNITWPQWQGLTKRYNKRQLVSFLMEQKCICGIGNYLKIEILNRAKLKPDRQLNSLSLEENYRFWQLTVKTPAESHSYGGLTIKDFWDPLGRKGVFPVRIYGVKPSPDGNRYDPDGNLIVLDKFADGRTTYWVPAVQK